MYYVAPPQSVSLWFPTNTHVNSVTQDVTPDCHFNYVLVEELDKKVEK